MTMAWTKDETSVDPPSMQMAPEEDLTIGLDTTALLGEGETPSSPVAYLYRVDTDEAITLQDAPTLAANILSQRLRGLTAGVTYRLRVLASIGGNTIAMTLYVECLK